ncbi:creatininase family protein [Kyrpidia sp.]|uniref:creatininase family protein n=1 Tax=Kyrpidia sp. TaxID=2073077 RepID=UPI00258B6F25|nr:creatininase family protein [Kyrpidia sp.]MCL6576518.1 creatininase family protein [Kyrpidia sp.]
MQRDDGGSWEERFLPRLTSEEIAKLPKDRALVVLPIGATEQHGSHLPIYTDTLIGEILLQAACDRLPEDAEIWFLPPIAFGKSNEHQTRPGTFSLSRATLEGVVLDLARSVRSSGFRRLLLFTTHGGNQDLLNMMARDIRIETGLMTFRLNGGDLYKGLSVFSEQEQALGIHGGAVETSLVMSAKPEWVRTDLLPSEFPNVADGEWFSFQKKTFAWLIDDVSSCGTCGDASQASIEHGWTILEYAARQLSQVLVAMACFDFPRHKPAVQNLEVP